MKPWHKWVYKKEYEGEKRSQIKNIQGVNGKGNL
jgi:hypothetical protein